MVHQKKRGSPCGCLSFFVDREDAVRDNQRHSHRGACSSGRMSPIAPRALRVAKVARSATAKRCRSQGVWSRGSPCGCLSFFVDREDAVRDNQRHSHRGACSSGRMSPIAPRALRVAKIARSATAKRCRSQGVWSKGSPCGCHSFLYSERTRTRLGVKIHVCAS